MSDIFDTVQTNPGVDGAIFATTEFTQDSTIINMPLTALVVGPIGGPFTIIGETDLPVKLNSPLPSGSNILGSVILINTVTNPKISSVSSSALSAGGTTSLTSSQVNGTANLLGILVSSSVSLKVILSTILNSISTSICTAILFDGIWNWTAPKSNLISIIENAGVGLDGFGVTITNLDPSFPADVYVTFFYEES